jgi:hypothetical protein
MILEISGQQTPNVHVVENVTGERFQRGLINLKTDAACHWLAATFAAEPFPPPGPYPPGGLLPFHGC